MDNTVSLKEFVDEVYRRPVLWDIEYESYKDRMEKKRAWEEVCRIFYHDYDEKTVSEKSGLCFTLTTKWKNLRDNYQRAVRKSINKVHIHSKLLYFLDDYEEKKQRIHDSSELDFTSTTTRSKRKRSEDNVKTDTNHEDKTFDIKTELMPVDNINDSCILYDNDNTSTNQHSISYDNTQTNQSHHEDDDLSFFTSTLPMVRTLNPRQKISFRIDVMNVLQKYMSK